MRRTRPAPCRAQTGASCAAPCTSTSCASAGGRFRWGMADPKGRVYNDGVAPSEGERCRLLAAEMGIGPHLGLTPSDGTYALNSRIRSASAATSLARARSSFVSFSTFPPPFSRRIQRMAPGSLVPMLADASPVAYHTIIHDRVRRAGPAPLRERALPFLGPRPHHGRERSMLFTKIFPYICVMSRAVPRAGGSRSPAPTVGRWRPEAQDGHGPPARGAPKAHLGKDDRTR